MRRVACITSGLDMALDEFDAVGNVLRETLSDRTAVVISLNVEPAMPPEHLRVSIIAAGVNAE